MALITKIANLFIAKNRDQKDDVKEFLNNLPNKEEWNKFVEGELKKTNEENNTHLGGQQPRTSMDEDDDGKDYEMNMDNIMAKFNSFSQKMSNSYNGRQEEDEEEDEEVHVEKNLEEEPHEGLHTIETEPLKGDEPLIKEYADNTYWKTDLYDENSLDDLMADYD